MSYNLYIKYEIPHPQTIYGKQGEQPLTIPSSREQIRCWPFPDHWLQDSCSVAPWYQRKRVLFFNSELCIYWNVSVLTIKKARASHNMTQDFRMIIDVFPSRHQSAFRLNLGFGTLMTQLRHQSVIKQQARKLYSFQTSFHVPAYTGGWQFALFGS